MSKNNSQIVGLKIEIIVVDPWITPYQFFGTIINISKVFTPNYVVVKLDEPIIYKEKKCVYFRMMPHNYSKKRIEELITEKILDCNMILISESDANIIDTEYMSVWKRDVSMTATIKVLKSKF
jgi:hypothetical protein